MCCNVSLQGKDIRRLPILLSAGPGLALNLDMHHRHAQPLPLVLAFQ